MTQPFHVPAHAVSSGAFVPLGTCPKHGRPAMRIADRRFTTQTPPWVIALAVVSLLIGLVVALAMQHKVVGRVPECDQCVADLDGWKRNAWIAWGGVALLLVLAIAMQSGGLFLLDCCAVVAAVVHQMLKSRHQLNGVLSRDLAWVTLRDVHPTWAAAVSQRMAAAATHLL